jgi:hypothetical protein
MKYTPEITVECIEEFMPIRGNLIASGDDEYDRQIEDKTIAELETNPWAWCCVKVTAEFRGITADAYLGGCNYKSEQSFKEDLYYKDLVHEATQELADKVKDLQDCEIEIL